MERKPGLSKAIGDKDVRNFISFTIEFYLRLMQYFPIN